MGVTIIDGTIEEVDAGRRRSQSAVFKRILFRQADGTTRTLGRTVTTGDVTDHIVVGNGGRFYTFTAFDLKGIHGVRRIDGTSVYNFPNINRKLFAVIAIMNIVWILLRVSTSGDVPPLGVGLIILGVVGFVLLSKAQNEALAQFDGDSLYRSGSAADDPIVPVADPA